MKRPGHREMGCISIDASAWVDAFTKLECFAFSSRTIREAFPCHRLRPGVGDHAIVVQRHAPSNSLKEDDSWEGTMTTSCWSIFFLAIWGSSARKPQQWEWFDCCKGHTEFFRARSKHPQYQVSRTRQYFFGRYVASFLSVQRRCVIVWVAVKVQAHRHDVVKPRYICGTMALKLLELPWAHSACTEVSLFHKKPPASNSQET